MGTCGVFGFRLNGKDKLTFVIQDGAPVWLGHSFLMWLGDKHITELANTVDKMVCVDPDSEVSYVEQLACERKGIKFNKGILPPVPGMATWVNLLRPVYEGMGIFTYWSKGLPYMLDAGDLILQSATCDYAYIMNLDSKNFEFWIGSQTYPQMGNRYGTIKQREASYYYPCALALEYSWEDLPVGDNPEGVIITEIVGAMTAFDRKSIVKGIEQCNSFDLWMDLLL